MNWLEVLKSAFQPYFDDHKPPLHIGEAYNLWYYYTGTAQSKRSSEVGYNVATDEELKNKILNLITDVHDPIISELHEFLLNEKVPLPQLTPEHPLVENQVQIPEHSKLNDEEIANIIIWNEIIGIQIAVRGLTESTRADVGAMFVKFQMQKMSWLLTMKQLVQKRGWIKIPPFYDPTR